MHVQAYKCSQDKSSSWLDMYGCSVLSLSLQSLICKMYQALPLLSWESLRTRIGVILHDGVLMLTSAVSYMCADMVIITETCEHTVHSSTKLSLH